MSPSFGNQSTSTPAKSLFDNQSSTPSNMFSFGNAQKDNTGAAGQPAAAGGGLFGGNQASNSLFGNASTTNTTSSPAPSPFGGGASTGTPPASSANMFGGLNKPATSSSPSNAFGGSSSTPATAAAGGSTTGASPFGGASSSGTGLFGGANTGAGSAPSTSAGTGNSLFSTTAAAGQATPTKPLFGGLGSTTPAGAPPSDSAKPSPSLFNQPSSGKDSRWEAKPAQNIFGGAASASKPSSNIFGDGSASTPTSQPSTSSSGNQNLFGAKPVSAGSTENSSLFKTASTGGTSSAPSLGGGANSLFGGKPASTTNPTSTAATTTTTSSASSLFPSLGGSAATSSKTAPKTSLFSTSTATPTTTSAAASVPASTTSLFSSTTTSAPAASASTTAPATSTSSLFGAKPAATQSSTSGATSGSTTATSFGTTPAPATAAAGTEKTATQTSATQNNMSASTMGPPSQLPRLKNKTMDEIITRWATDLQKYQKEFKDQATKVAAWDRLLVENGEKIQKLYLQTHEAEKASNEIDRQLQSVESHQAELESFLDRYEKEVDDMYSKQIGGNEQLAGPDQERERTYKLAETLTDRLDEMGKDLGKMITEINDISGSLSKGNKPDDPLSQIVRVLNGHLQQLQWIDTNASALQAKVNAAQKATNNIGSKYGNPDSDAAESFYRSYMGRR